MDDFSLDGGDTFEPKVDIAETGPCSRTITITIPASVVDERLEMQLGTLISEAALPGFRKGRVPRKLLERRFGADVRNETRGQLISSAYEKALATAELQVIGDPDFGDMESIKDLEPGHDYAFSVSLEVVPDFELPELDGVPVTKPIMEVNEEHVDGEILRTRYRFGAPARITGPFEPLDRMVGSVAIHIGDSAEPLFENDRAVAVVPAVEDEGKGQFIGLLVEDLSDHLTGKSVGDEITFETTGPESHEREDIRGKTLKISFQVTDAERVTPLEISQIVEQFGLDDEAGLRAQIRLSLESRRDAEQRNAEREQVYEWLLENIDFELPPKISEAQAAGMIEQQRLEMTHRGLDEDTIELQLAKMRGESETASRKRLRLMFIMSKLSKHFEINITEDEVNARISEIAASRGARPDAVRAELAKTGQIREISMSIQHSKSADRIVDTAKVTEMPAEDWNKLVDAKAAAKS
jgi:trigger factor